MKWTIREIKEHAEDIMQFQEVLQLEPQLKTRDSSIISVEPVHVAGYFSYSPQDIILHGEIDLKIVLPSTRTMEPVPCHLKIPIRERYVYPEHDNNRDDYEETTIVLEEDAIDISEVIIDLIIVNLPVKVYNTDEDEDHFPQGKDWEVITEDAFIKQQRTKRQEEDNPFDVLKDLLIKEEDSE